MSISKNIASSKIFFEKKFLFSIFIVQIIVGVFGVFSYLSINDIFKQLEIVKRPYDNNILLKQVLTDLSNIENSSKLYAINKNSNYLVLHDISFNDLNRCLIQLNKINKNNPQELKLLQLLVLNIKKLDDIKKAKYLSTGDTILQEELIDLSLSKIDTLRPKTEDVPVKLTQVSYEQKIKNNISYLTNKLGEIEYSKIRAHIEKTSVIAKKANLLIGLLCLVTEVLLLVICYLVYKYVKNRRRYRKNLKISKLDAERLAEARKKFLAHITHELRTPLNSIFGFTQQLLKTKLDEDQEELLQIIRSSSDHLLNIINEVLDFSKIEETKTHFESINFSPTKLIDEVIQSLTLQANNKKITMQATFADGIPQIINGDPTRLRQILLNLIGNAIKFTDRGSVKINVSTKVIDKNYIALNVSIQDTGIGISADRIPHVFESFEQANDTISIKYGGTGLGLPISKKLIKLQNGKIEVESEISKGTKISFSIPYKVENKQDNAVEPINIADYLPLIRGKKILIADDEKYNRLLIKAIFKNLDIETEEALDGKEAFDKVCSMDFDVVLMDVRMPKMTGLEASFLIRKLDDKKKSEIPIIALTAGILNEKKKECIDAGMNEFISKPYREEDLIEKICKVLQLKL